MILIATASEDAQQGQQVGKYIVNIQIQSKRCRNVVGLAAVDDLLHIEQDVSRENRDGNHRNGKIQSWQMQKNISHPAIRITMTPANSHFPSPEKSRLDTVATLAMTANTAAVPPKAIMINDAPLEKPST